MDFLPGNDNLNIYTKLPSAKNPELAKTITSLERAGLFDEPTTVPQYTNPNDYLTPIWMSHEISHYSSYGTQSYSGSVGPSKNVSEKGKQLLQNREFMNKVISIAQRIGCDYKDLLGVMRAESGLNSGAVNKKSGASGLIQFMPKTARGLGTSVEAIRNMSAVQQLDYVEAYLLKAKKSAGFSDGESLSAGQLYALVFLPARAKRDVLTSKGEAAYNWNSGTDINGDGQITRAEMDARAKRFRVDDYIPMEYMA